jgi:hypothetical protein
VRIIGLRKLPKILFVALGCLQLVGGPYSILQICAWTNMLVEYSRNDGLLQAAKDTFGGRKPCGLCCKIQTARQSERKENAPASPAATQSGKLFQDMVPLGDVVILAPVGVEVASIGYVEPPLCSGIGSAAPPTPPPCRVG